MGQIVDITDISRRFSMHSINDDQSERMTGVRHKMLEAARYVEEKCPSGREKSLALTKLEEALFWANASISRNTER